MRVSTFFLAITLMFTINAFSAGDIWLHLLSSGQPIGTYYLGDVLPEYWINVEIGQEAWDASDIGIGPSSSIGENWETAIWYADGSYPNKQVHSNLQGTQFTSTGSWYFYGRARSEATDDWHYANSTTWENTPYLSATEYFTIEALSNPTGITATAQSSSTIDLSWTLDGSHWVMIVRNTADSWTAPNQGTAYSVGDLIGDGTVIYFGNGTSVTDNLLSSSTQYYYKIYTENNSYYSDGATSVNATTNAGVSSTTSGNWNSTSTWSGSAVPTSVDNVTISNLVTIAAPGECANLTISSSGSMTINASQTLTVNGTMTMNSGASLLETGTLTAGSVLIQRAISGYTTSTDGWHMMSSPIVAMTIGESDFSPASNEDLYFWSEEYNLWINYKDGATPSFTTVNGGDVMNPGTGYLVAYNSTSTKEFDDLSPDDNSPNNSDIIKSSLPYHTGNTYTGYNLLGNPFPCALQWGTAEWLLTNVNTTAKVWNEGGASFTDVAANGYIPAMNGFMVYVSSTTNSLKIPKAARAHNSTPWYKSAETTTNEIKLTATDTEGSTFQETVIKFNAGATEGFDMDGDSKFMYGYAPAFYSVIEDAFLSTNSLPELKDGLVVPLGFTKNEATHFTINAEGLDNLDPQLKVSLVDLKLNYTQVLSDNPVYEFLAEEGDDADRFELHFGVTGINDNPAAQPLNAWYTNGQLHLAGVDSPATVSLTDLQGRTLWQEEHLNLNLNLSLNLSLTPGIYLVSVTESTRTRTAKIYIR